MNYALVSKQNSKYNLRRGKFPPSMNKRRLLGNPANWIDLVGLYLTLNEAVNAFNEESTKNRKWIQIIELDNFHIVRAERLLLNLNRISDRL
jgi:hypothetical protein